MPELTLTRIPFTETADKQLRILKARTGLPANILCRLGFCLSLEEIGIPRDLQKGFSPGREINRYILLGEYDSLYIALLTTRMIQDKQPLSTLNSFFLAHLDRGIALISSRFKTVDDIAPKRFV